MIDTDSLKLIHSDDPSVEDDHFEIRNHENFNIQVCSSESGPYHIDSYIVNERDGSTFIDHGEYTSIAFAINKINELLEARNAAK